MCSGGGLRGLGVITFLSCACLYIYIYVFFNSLLFLERQRRSWCYAFNMFLELLKGSWCSAFNGCKTQLHSDGAKSWPKWCSQHAPQVENFHVSLTQQKSVRKESETQEETWGSGRWHTMCRPLVAKSWQGIASVSSRQRQTWRWHCWKTNVICLGFRVAKQFGQPCQLDQRVGKDHVTWNEPGEQMKKNTFERNGGWASQEQKNCKYQYKTNMCVLKPQRNPTFIFTQSTKCCKACKIWTWRNA